MQTRITPDELQAAARQLAKTERGRLAMQRLHALLEGDALDLDLLDQRAFLALVGGAWTGQREKTRDVIGATLGGAKPR
jgi:hypothetical protein